MAESKIEEVARAIAAHDGGGLIMPDDHDFSLLLDHQKDRYRRLAKAAIEAMKKPNEVMLTAGAQSIDPSSVYGGKRDPAMQRTASKCFTAMITAALEGE